MTEMTADDEEQFLIWRAELVAERDEFAAKLETEQQMIVSLEGPYGELVATRKRRIRLVNSVAVTLSEIPGLHDISGALHARVENDGRDELQKAASALAAARGRAKSLQESIADRVRGIAQIDRALTAAKVTELKPTAEPTGRRKPAMVDFDDIVMPREATHV